MVCLPSSREHTATAAAAAAALSTRGATTFQISQHVPTSRQLVSSVLSSPILTLIYIDIHNIEEGAYEANTLTLKNWQNGVL